MDTIYYIPDCGCRGRLRPGEKNAGWLGALLGIQDLGCALNVLVFLGAVSQTYAESEIPRLDPKVGTPFQSIISYIQPTCNFPLREKTFPLQDETKFADIIDEIESGLKYGITHQNRHRDDICTDACTIIKFNRVGVGHTVIMSYERDETGHARLFTVDPQKETYHEILESSGSKESMMRKRSDKKLFHALIKGGIVSISIISAQIDPGGGNIMVDRGSLDSPVHGTSPLIPWPGNRTRAAERYLEKPVDLTKHGKVYSIMAHGTMNYKLANKDDGKMPHDSQGRAYDIECLHIPKNIVILTLTSVGENLDGVDIMGTEHNRTMVGLPYLSTMGAFKYERWGASGGRSHFKFPNYNLKREFNKGRRSAMGIFQRTGPNRSDMSRVVNIEKGDETVVLNWYNFSKGRICDGRTNSEIGTLRDAIEVIKRDASFQGGKQKIYIFCIFCLGEFAPISLDKVRKCCDQSSLDLQTNSRVIASKKKKKSRRKNKSQKKT
jgi:hypothetical protein